MLLAMDIGNSSIRVGVFRTASQAEDTNTLPEACFKLSTDARRSADEYAFYLRAGFELHAVDMEECCAVMLCSVVPDLTEVLRQSVHKLTDAPIYTVGPGLKCGVNIRTEDPSELGADIVANAAGALAQCDAPLILIDMGTATSVFVVDGQKTILGGCIAPGIKIGLNALKDATSLLPAAALEQPAELVGKNTEDAVRSGVVLGHAMMLDGMIDAYRTQLGEQSRVVMTGGLARIVMPAMRHAVAYEENLTLIGLYRIFLLNRKRILRENAR